MTTPASGQISFGDLKSELSLVGGPSADISLALAAFDVMADGFYDTFGFTGQTSFGAGPVSLSFFYDLQTDAEYIFAIDGNVTDYDLFESTLANQSKAGGGSGANEQPTNFKNPATGTISPGTTNGEPIVHMEQLEVQVICVNNSGRPPFTDLYMDWSDGSGFIAFAGSPFNGPSLNVLSGIQTNAPNDINTPKFEVRCYQ